uniref:Uncharacterized protein n=1 Tax=Rhizophora mucronata TaxID=61149 RepID=A0A2P2PZW4_RHIMU
MVRRIMLKRKRLYWFLRQTWWATCGYKF